MKISNRRLKTQISALIGFSLSGMTMGIVYADSVHYMCTDSDEICECAARKLNAEVGDKRYELYEAVGAVYLTNKDAGMAMADAWDAAVTSEGGKQGDSFINTLGKTNKIGRAHREALKMCKGDV